MILAKTVIRWLKNEYDDISHISPSSSYSVIDILVGKAVRWRIVLFSDRLKLRLTYHNHPVRSDHLLLYSDPDLFSKIKATIDKNLAQGIER